MLDGKWGSGKTYVKIKISILF
ncbi:MAG: hypothetical protein WC860_03265 [Candidatus Margulisiibacteriota bacterium]